MIYVAKHGCGFAAWKSKVAYNYSVTNAPDQTDVVAAFVKSARAGGIGDRNAPAFTFEGLRGGAHFVGTSATQPNLSALTQLVRKHLQ